MQTKTLVPFHAIQRTAQTSSLVFTLSPASRSNPMRCMHPRAAPWVDETRHKHSQVANISINAILLRLTCANAQAKQKGKQENMQKKAQTWDGMTGRSPWRIVARASTGKRGRSSHPHANITYFTYAYCQSNSAIRSAK